MAKAPKPFSLPEEAKRSLTTMLGKGIHPARTLTRARILLKRAEGLRPLHITRELDVAENTVYNVRNKAEKQGRQAALEFALARRFEWHYTPKQGSWLNTAELERSVIVRQCLGRRIATQQEMAARSGS